MATTSAVSGSTNLGGYLVRDTDKDKISDEISPDGGKTWVSASSSSGKALMTKAMQASIGGIISSTKQMNSSGILFNSAPNKTLTHIATSKPAKVVTSIADGSAATAAIKGTIGAAGSVLDVLKALLDPFLWERIGIGALGLLLIIFGFVLMAESNKTVQTITKAVAV